MICNLSNTLISAILCEDGFVYKACVSPCDELQCNEPYSDEECKAPCVEGCGCRDNQVLMNGM